MARLAYIQIGGAGYRRARRDQIRRIELSRTGFALVAASAARSAMGAGAHDVTIGKEAVVRRTEYLIQRALLDEAVPIELREKVLRQSMVAGRRRPSEVVER
jgi:hypothetical protein